MKQYTYDGNRALDYDDENELIRVTVTNNWKSEFTYDGKMRRRIRKEFLWQNGGWALSNEVHYIYDGNLVVQERDASNVPTVSYTRGRDLGSSLQGAGGIGGLLARTDDSTITPQHAFYHADGNGNVTMLINSLQLAVAKYLYDPFGNILSKSGSLSEANLYCFSSKEAHPASGLVYYLYRFYDPNLQRWPNRDPIGEAGGINLYGYVGNSPLNRIDPLGLDYGWPVVPPPGYPPTFPPKPPPDTSIRKCNRKIENPSNDFVIGCANLRGHDYFDWPDGNGGRGGVGFQDPNGKDGSLPGSEAGSQPRSCRPCYKSNSPLKYGVGAGKA